MAIHGSHASHYGGGGGGGSELAALAVLVFFLIFFSVLGYKYYKARKARKLNGTPIPWGKILLQAFLCGLIIGFIFLLAEECCCSGDSGGSADVESQQPIAPEMPQMQQPMQQPGMDWTPINNAATAPVQ